MKNRITLAFARMEKQIAQRLESGQTSQEQLDVLYKDLDLDSLEHCRFQEHKSLAVTEGKLTLEEGMTVYRALGGVPDVFNTQPLHIKVVLTNLFGELLAWCENEGKK